jgi:predicted transcriptional regulator
MSEQTNEPSVIELATELTVAWLSNANTRVSADEVPAFLNKMRESIAAFGGQCGADEHDYLPGC